MLSYAIKSDFLTPLIHEHLLRSGDVDYRRFRRTWRRFIRILFFHYGTDGVSVHVERLNACLWGKLNVQVYLMVGCGWLAAVPHRRKHTVITPKGVALVRECLRMVEREYSTFYVEQQAYAASLVPVKAKRRKKVLCKPVSYGVFSVGYNISIR